MTQPALLPGCCSRPLQDSDSEFKVVFLAAVRAKFEQRDRSHLASHASAAIVFVVIDILLVHSERKLPFFLFLFSS